MGEGDRPPFTFTRDYSVPRPRSEQAFLIPASEWERLKRMIRRISPVKNWFQVGGSVCAGVCISAMFALVGFSQSKDVPTWARVVCWVAIVSGILLAVSLFYLDSQQAKTITGSASDVLADMEELEQAYEASEPPNDADVNQ